MPGVGQLWLTHREIEALLLACRSANTVVTGRVWEDIEAKLLDAQQGLSCPLRSKPKLRWTDALYTDDPALD